MPSLNIRHHLPFRLCLSDGIFLTLMLHQDRCIVLFFVYCNAATNSQQSAPQGPRPIRHRPPPIGGAGHRRGVWSAAAGHVDISLARSVARELRSSRFCPAGRSGWGVVAHIERQRGMSPSTRSRTGGITWLSLESRGRDSFTAGPAMTRQVPVEIVHYVHTCLHTDWFVS